MVYLGSLDNILEFDVCEKSDYPCMHEKFSIDFPSDFCCTPFVLTIVNTCFWIFQKNANFKKKIEIYKFPYKKQVSFKMEILGDYLLTQI
jgi:hypothetical protein